MATVKRWEPVNIGDTDENADWIKTPENQRTEREIHDRLAKEYRRGQGKQGRQED